jgi:hypothetical protein
MDLSAVILWSAVVGGIIGIGIVLVRSLLGRMFSWIDRVEIDDDDWNE